jgi:lysophospholipase L1-like esterase
LRKGLIYFCFIFFNILFLFNGCAQSSGTEEAGFDYSQSILNLETISESENLNSALKRLHSIHKNIQNKNYKGDDTIFIILHIGDSHIQGDYFTSVIRKQLQNYFGDAGQGILFPYALAQSYGPKGVEANAIGKWKGIKTMSQNIIYPLGVSGYGTFINSVNSSLTVRLNEKFDADPQLSKEAPVQKINIWHSSGPASFSFSLGNNFKVINKKIFPEWGVTTFLSSDRSDSFTIRPEGTNGGQSYFGFYGFELLPMRQKGIAYHHCGVVGAQFTHLIRNSALATEQIKCIKPDIIVFSFGTNEAYNGNFNSSTYTAAVKKFISEIKKVSPTTAVIFTTAPDTRSQGKKPPQQTNVNNAIKAIAEGTSSSIYDLNAAMGGWGSMNTWFKKQLTLKDKLHFNTEGYAIQGKMFAYALMQQYNRLNHADTLNLNPVRNSLGQFMKLLVGQKSDTTDKLASDSIDAADISKNENVPPSSTKKDKKKTKTNSPKKKVHIVKKGETLSHISRIYSVSVKALAKANGITIKKVLKLGQRLFIP